MADSQSEIVSNEILGVTGLKIVCHSGVND